MKTRITTLLGIEHPIIQAGMSWASSNAALPLAVSRAGGLGMIAAGPMRLPDLQAAIRAVKAGTDRPYAVNVPLYRPGSAEILDLCEAERVPIIVASQGGPKAHLARFRALGTKWLHVVASIEHAKKAADAGVDGLVVVGFEAGGHPPPDEVSTLVVVRRVATAVPHVPIVAGGGAADGAGIVALLALGADAVQLGTRFLMTPEAGVHGSYQAAVLGCEINGTTMVGRGMLPVRMLKNGFAARFLDAERNAVPVPEREMLFKSSTLKMAALDGDVDGGKVEAGQTAGLIDDVVPAGDLVARLVREMDAARARLAAL